ncbi:MAG: CBS domain-containing protein [Candidatus Bathyarchaeia archaeon]
MISTTVKNVFSKGFESVRETETLSRCFSLFKEEMPPVLIVSDHKGKYKGVITRRWIVRSRLDPAKTKVKKLMRSAPTVSLHDSLNRAARLMIESEIRQLPVYSGEKLLGFITDESVIHGAVMENWGVTEIRQIMTRDPLIVEENESVGSVISLFREEGISHAPVVSGAKLVGMISVHDIVEHIFKPRKRQTLGEIVGESVPVLNIPAKGIMTKPVITVLPDVTLRDAEEKMLKFDISSLVIARKERPVGIVTKRDFLEPIAQAETARRRLAVQFSVKDVAIDEIQRDFIMADFESFARRYQETLEAGTLFIYLKTHGTNFKGDQLIHCRLQLRTRKGSFFSSSEGWGAEQTFRMALDKLERQILKSKEFEHKPEFAKAYLRRISFPLTEL